MSDDDSAKAMRQRGEDRRKRSDPDYKGPERRKGERRAGETVKG